MSKKRARKVRDPADTDQDVLTIDQAAELLQLSRGTMYNLLNDPDSGIPARRILGRWRFSRAALLEWVEGRDD